MRRRPSLLLLCVPVLLAAPSRADELETFSRKLAAVGEKTRSLRATFVQIKRLRLFKSEVTTKGTIAYKRPHHLRWQTLPPDESLILVSGQQAELRLPSEPPRVIDLRRNRTVGMLVGQLLVWLGVKPLQGLKRGYDVKVIRDGKQTVAQLTPKEASQKKLVQQIRAFFSMKMALQRIEVLQADGDSTSITFSEIERS